MNNYIYWPPPKILLLLYIYIYSLLKVVDACCTMLSDLCSVLFRSSFGCRGEADVEVFSGEQGNVHLNALPPLLSCQLYVHSTKKTCFTLQCELESGFTDIRIISLSETWIDKSVSHAEVRLDNFTINGSNRSSESGKLQRLHLYLQQVLQQYVSLTYIPPSANSKAGAKLVTQDTNGALARYHGGPRGF